MPTLDGITWDDQRLKRDRVHRLQAQLKQLGVGALYISDGVHIQYVLATKVPGGKLFVPAEGEPIAFVRPRDVGYVAMVHERIMPPFYTNTWEPQNEAKLERFAQGIADLMAQHGVGGEPLGVDPLEAPAFSALVRAGIPVTDARPPLEYAKSIKTEDEIAIYRLIGQQYRRTFEAFREALRPGVTEKQLHAVVTSKWYECGGEDIRQLNVCAGEHTNPWRRWPTDRPLQDGDLVGIDFHGNSAKGLQGDVSRTYLVGGHPTPRQRDLYARAWDYLEQTTAVFRADVRLADVLSLAPKVPDRYTAQLYNYDIAHPIGMTPSGYPMIKMVKDLPDDVLREGQVFAIESYFGEKGAGLAVKLEHMIRVTDSAPELFDAEVPGDPVLRG